MEAKPTQTNPRHAAFAVGEEIMNRIAKVGNNCYLTRYTDTLTITQPNSDKMKSLHSGRYMAVALNGDILKNLIDSPI